MNNRTTVRVVIAAALLVGAQITQALAAVSAARTLHAGERRIRDWRTEDLRWRDAEEQRAEAHALHQIDLAAERSYDTQLRLLDHRDELEKQRQQQWTAQLAGDQPPAEERTP